ncbi:MAG: cupin domain-containing protein [Candidatus Staskawiczbacteria bacterium CG10_big_fil_rev_8_21_14_0_10_38_10]|uniref:Cupin domain-containing protein n=1 Tax=Candidatus Staskawiczbacteria bacterium CG10_big_fil_rev_8_21_14_0_10_38_10 TaxID=1974891 RepID=A0A2H9T1E1_9BACT|nr:MAG: cupin domain-containing protein [Candidatus Staskawiczbacteria bacterium CG10_big_fil_rev_8_21_14_0_10_38_10]
MNTSGFFSGLVANLDVLDLKDPRVSAWMLETKKGQQIVLMCFRQDFCSDEFHVNNCSQWGVVLGGEMVLWTDKKRVLKKGDTFFIPEGMPHRVRIRRGYKDITVFDGQRYSIRTKKGGDEK